MGKLFIKNLIGLRFGRLLVQERVIVAATATKPRVHWRASCDCGRTVIVATQSLQQRTTQSCGCLRRGHPLPAGQAAFNYVLASTKRGAKVTGRSFDLSADECRELFTAPCHYCGVEPFRKKVSNGGVFLFNGIDRVDNQIGYVRGNVVSCCFPCNKAKGTRSAEEFVEHAMTIARFQASETEERSAACGTVRRTVRPVHPAAVMSCSVDAPRPIAGSPHEIAPLASRLEDTGT